MLVWDFVGWASIVSCGTVVLFALAVKSEGDGKASAFFFVLGFAFATVGAWCLGWVGGDADPAQARPAEQPQATAPPSPGDDAQGLEVWKETVAEYRKKQSAAKDIIAKLTS